MIAAVLTKRPLGRTGIVVSEVSFGAWAIGGDWGEVTEADALAGVEAALVGGVNLFDTADVYGRGRSEELQARCRSAETSRYAQHVADRRSPTCAEPGAAAGRSGAPDGDGRDRDLAPWPARR